MTIAILFAVAILWIIDRHLLYRYLDNLTERCVQNYKDIVQVRLDVNGEMTYLNSRVEDLEMYTARLSQDIKAVAEDPNHIF